MDAHPPTGAAARRGVQAAAVLAFAWMVLWAGATPAFWGVDTTSHVAYAVEAANGRWPTIDTPNPAPDLPGLHERLDYDVAFGRPARLDVWTSNHPPLYFVTVGLPLRLGLAVGSGGVGLLLARLLTAVGAAAGVLAVGWLARVVMPGRPRLAVLAAAGAGLSPTLVHYGGQIYNDTLAATLSTVGLAAGIAALRSGPTRRLVAIGVVAAGAGALTRSSSLAVAAVTVLAFAAAGWRHGAVWAAPAGLAPRGPRGAGAAGLVVGAGVAATAGPAVLVNLARYGSVTAASALFEKFDRLAGPNALISLMSRPFYRDQINRFASELSIGVWWPSTTSRLVEMLVAASLLGILRTILRREWPREPWDLLGWALAVLPIALMVVASAVFVHQGGFPHGRYALPGLAGLAVLWAAGIEGLPGGRRPALPVTAVAVLVVANVTLFADFLVQRSAWYAEALPAADLPLLVPLRAAVIPALLLGVPALLEVVRALLTVGHASPVPQPSSSSSSASALNSP